jgi:hypothetical protein
MLSFKVSKVASITTFYKPVLGPRVWIPKQNFSLLKSGNLNYAPHCKQQIVLKSPKGYIIKRISLIFRYIRDPKAFFQ